MPIRVLHLIPTLDLTCGGPRAILFGLAESQVAAGLEVSILTTFVGPESFSTAEELRRLGAHVAMIGPVRGKLMQHPALATTVIRAVKTANIVHIHGVWEDLQHHAVKACQQAGVPYVVTPHGMLTSWSVARRRWAKRLFLAWRVRANLNGAALVHFLTETERRLTAPLGLRPSVLVQAAGGLRLAEFDRLPARGAFRSRFSQVGDRPLVLFMGRIAIEKGLRYLIPAMRYIEPREAVLAIVGPDSKGYQALLQAEVNRLGLRERVVFTGMLAGAERIEALVDADVFCAPSDHESFGVAIVEALAAGLPSLVSDGVSIHRDLVRAGVGAVVERDSKALAVELSRWLHDHSMRRAAAAKCRPFVWDHFGAHCDAQNWDRIYRDAAGGTLNGKSR